MGGPRTFEAGTFDCFKVEGETYSDWQNADGTFQNFLHGRTRTIYWYCPAIKWTAKWETVYTAAYTGYTGAARVTIVDELVSFEQKR
jgi:hypothetical protein